MDLISPLQTIQPRTILVTGCSRGIGAEIVAGLLRDGHQVVATARRRESMNPLIKLAEQLEATDRLLTLQMDVCQQESVDDVGDRVDDLWGGVDVIINNAGVADSAPLHRTDDALWSSMIEINLTGSFRVTRRFLSKMRKRDYGRVIFISSIAGLTGCLYTSAYCAAKHGVIGMMRALALEVAPTAVTANAICPGFVETDMARNAMNQIEASTQRDASEARASLEAFTPQKRLFQVDEILHVTRFLISEGARGINGQAITVDGGQVMH